MTDSPEFTAKLQSHRETIDRIDDQLMALIEERLNVVRQVGMLKRSAGITNCFIRAGREASMLRRIAENFRRSDFSTLAAIAIWRQIIAASTHVEGELTLSIAAPTPNEAIVWLAREYFGNLVTPILQPSASRVIGDVMEKRAAVGILPAPSFDDNERWWPMLAGDSLPRIFALLPPVAPAVARGARAMPQALAVALIEPEDSGSDQTYLSLSLEESVSTSRLQAVFRDAGLDMELVDLGVQPQAQRQALVRIAGFLQPDAPMLGAIEAALGDGLRRACVIGAHGTPIALEDA